MPNRYARPISRRSTPASGRRPERTELKTANGSQFEREGNDQGVLPVDVSTVMLAKIIVELVDVVITDQKYAHENAPNPALRYAAGMRLDRALRWRKRATRLASAAERAPKKQPVTIRMPGS